MGKLGVIFDMDGVLVNSYQAHFESWRAAAACYDLEDISEGQFAAIFGRTSREIIRRLWGPALPDEDVPKMDALKEQAYRRIISAASLEMDGAGELIAARVTRAPVVSTSPSKTT